MKITGAIVIMNYYESYNNRDLVDIFKYYDDGVMLKQQTQHSPKIFLNMMMRKQGDEAIFSKIAYDIGSWETSNPRQSFQGNRLMIRLNAILSLLTGNNYLIHLLFFTILSFTGLLYAINAIPSLNSKNKSILLALLTLSPTLLFWSSGILKESLIVFLLGMLIHHYYKSKNASSSYQTILLVPVILYGIWVIKPFILIALLPSLVALIIHHLFKIRIITSGIIVTFLIVTSLLLSDSNASYHPLQITNSKLTEFKNLSEKYDAASFYFTPEVSSPFELIYSSPIASFNTLFRPSILEVRKKSYLPFVMENTLLLLACILLLFFPNKQIDRHWLIISLLFIISVATIIGLTTPIFGASIRYRVPAIFVLYILLFLLSKPINSILVRKKTIN